MQTSYFKIAGNHPNAVAICNGTRGFNVKTYKVLAPDWNDVRTYREGSLSWDEFATRYRAKLSRLDPRKAYADLVAIAGPDPILLCWEGPGCNCHRHITARWLEAGNGLTIREYAIATEATLFDQVG